MSFDYEKWEKACNKIRKSNDQLLNQFNAWLEKQKAGKKTIKNHVENIRFYINDYLLYEEPTEPDEGVFSVDDFLGYWFIKKAMWANESSIRQFAASLKKFYSFMLEIGRIKNEDLDELKDTIKEGMPEWIGTCKRYDDPSITDIEDIWDF